MSWKLTYTKQAQKDAQKLAAAGLKPKAKLLLDILAENPFQNPPPYEKCYRSWENSPLWSLKISPS